MKGRHFVIVGMLAIAALASAWALIPRGPELALMRLKDKQYEAARQAYETHLAAGDRSTSLVGALTKLYLQYGEIDAAIRLMGRYVGEHPRDLDARRRLGTLYQYSQRPDLFLTNLEKIAEARPNEEDLRELARGYNFLGRHDDQSRVLRRLIDLGWGQQSDYLDSANLLGAQRRFEEAALLLTAWMNRAPKNVDIAFVEFLGKLLEDAGKPEEAYRQAVAWIERNPVLEDAGRLGEMLHFYKRPDLAVRLLTPYASKADESPRLLTCLTQAEIEMGQRERAFDRLEQLRRGGRLDESLRETFVDLALQARRMDLALDAAGLAAALPPDEAREKLRALPDWLLGNLAETANSERRVNAVLRMHELLGDGFLQDRPLLAAEIALGRGDRIEAARWVDAAASKVLAGQWDNAGEPVALADLLGRLDRAEQAAAVLEQVADKGRAGDDTLVALAQLYLDLGRAAQGIDRFAAWIASRRTPRVQAAWALLAASAGRDAELAAWLGNAPTQALTEETLKDISYLSGDHGSREVQIKSSELLLSRYPKSEHRRSLAEALVAAGRPLEALEHLRPLVQSGALDVQSVYGEALLAAAREGAQVDAELRRYVSGRLSGGMEDGTEREALIQALVDTRNWETALPEVARLARTKGGPWFWVYVEALESLNRRADLASFLASELERTDLTKADLKIRMTALLDRGGAAEALPVLSQWAEESGGEWMAALEEALGNLGRKGEFVTALRARIRRHGTSIGERRELAWRLVEAGDKKSAEDAFFVMAQAAPAGDRDVAQLLYLWGPRPSGRALEWMESRARAAAGAERAAWMDHLTNTGAAHRAAQVGVSASHAPEEVSALVRALQADRDVPALSRLIDTEIASAVTTDRLRALARLAGEESLNRQTAAAYTKLLDLAPADRESLIRLGKLAFAEGRYTAARELLDRSLTAGARDWECYWLMGDLLARDRRPVEAQKAYHEALSLLAAERNRPFSLRAAEALLLHKTRREAEAKVAFEKLLVERPGDTNVKADYAAVLMEEGRYERAEQVLAKH